MGKQLQQGQQVTVNAYPAKRPVVTVVEDRGDIVLVCKPEEYASALAENRSPAAIGFRREDVLDEAPPLRKDVGSHAASERRSSMAGD